MKFYQIFKTFTYKEKIAFWGALAVFVIAFISFGLFYYYSKTVEAPASGGQYTEGIMGQPTYVNPVIAGNNEIDSDISEIVFADLIKLADHYNVSPDGKTWNVVLKSDLLWSDKKPLTSDDVIFTIETIQDLNARSPLYQTWQGIAANRISELEIQFDLRNTYAFFLDNLKELRIIPKHIFGVIPAANIRQSDYNLEPVSSGPYKFTAYEKRKDGFITDYHFDVNENYAGDQPLIQNFNIKFFPNADELISAFNSRKIDGFGDLNPKNIGDLKLNYKLTEIYMPRYYAIFLNSATKQSLKEIAVRTALELATDKNKIIEKVFDNKAKTVNQPILPMMSDYDSSTDNSEFSIEKAKEILEKEMWIANPDTGIREKKIGKITEKLEFDVIIPQIQFLIDTINIIKNDWQEAGIKINPIILNPSDITEEIIKTRNYQMMIFGNILKINPDIFSFWHSSERFYPGLNLALYENKKVDGLLESIRKNFNEESRKNDVKTLLSLFSSEKPAILLYSPAYIYVSPQNLGGIGENTIATPAGRFDNIDKWYLRTTRTFKD